ncbi:hypothetical protein BHE74_00059316, partial [Ensete ventricosum]
AAVDVTASGEEWLAAAIEKESKAAVKKAGWKLLGNDKGRGLLWQGRRKGGLLSIARNMLSVTIEGGEGCWGDQSSRGAQ